MVSFKINLFWKFSIMHIKISLMVLLCGDGDDNSSSDDIDSDC